MNERLEKVAQALFEEAERECLYACPWEKLTAPEQSNWFRLAQVAIDAMGLTEEWAVTCDRWKGGRMVRSTRHEAVADAVTATKRSLQYASLEPPPPSPEEMRLERRLVGGWVVVDNEEQQ